MGQPSALLRLATLAVIATAIAACGAKADAPQVSSTDDALAVDGSDTNAVEGDTALLASSFVSAAAHPVIATSYFQPKGCLTSAIDSVNATATLTLTHCAGPLGLRDISGDLHASWTTDAATDAFTLTLAGTGLHVNRATVDTWNATATVTTQGTLRTMQWASTLSGATARGRPIARNVSMTYAWTVGDACVTASGTSTGDVTGRELDTTVTSYQRCGAACPAEGSVTVRDAGANRSLTIDFDGTTSAEVTLPGGAAERVALACAEE
jgi:hypothetical protein